MNADHSCAHCHRPLYGFGVAADGSVLCHTDDPRVDCYRLVTVYRHKTDGSCCRISGRGMSVEEQERMDSERIEGLYAQFAEFTAEQCMLRKLFEDVSNRRAETALQLQEAGEPYRQIGRRTGISAPRAAQLGKQAKENRALRAEEEQETAQYAERPVPKSLGLGRGPAELSRREGFE